MPCLTRVNVYLSMSSALTLRTRGIVGPGHNIPRLLVGQKLREYSLQTPRYGDSCSQTDLGGLHRGLYDNLMEKQKESL